MLNATHEELLRRDRSVHAIEKYTELKITWIQL